MTKLPRSFQKHGIKEYAAPDHKRLLVSSEGETGTRKTSFALEAPDPLLFVNYDDGLEDVIDRYTDQGKVIGVHSVRMDPVIDKRKDGETLGKLKAAWLDACLDPDVKTLVVDTGGNLWEHIRRAEFGRLEKVPPMFYAGANACFRQFIDQAFLNGKNLIIVHSMKDEYLGERQNKGGEEKLVEVKTGKRMRAGFGNMEYRIQLNIRHWKDISVQAVPDKFKIDILKCRPNTEMEGYTVDGEMEPVTFLHLAELCYPELENVEEEFYS